VGVCRHHAGEGELSANKRRTGSVIQAGLGVRQTIASTELTNQFWLRFLILIGFFLARLI
jgi:hypothetical protein